MLENEFINSFVKNVLFVSFNSLYMVLEFAIWKSTYISSRVETVRKKGKKGGECFAPPLHDIHAVAQVSKVLSHTELYINKYLMYKYIFQVQEQGQKTNLQCCRLLILTCATA